MAYTTTAASVKLIYQTITRPGKTILSPVNAVAQWLQATQIRREKLPTIASGREMKALKFAYSYCQMKRSKRKIATHTNWKRNAKPMQMKIMTGRGLRSCLIIYLTLAMTMKPRVPQQSNGFFFQLLKFVFH